MYFFYFLKTIKYELFKKKYKYIIIKKISYRIKCHYREEYSLNKSNHKDSFKNFVIIM